MGGLVARGLPDGEPIMLALVCFALGPDGRRERSKVLLYRCAAIEPYDSAAMGRARTPWSQQKCTSERCKWAREELNLRPLPCQQNTGNRCARRRSPRSRLTVGAVGKRSLGIQGNALFTPRIDAHELLNRIVQLRLCCPVPELRRRMHTDLLSGAVRRSPVAQPLSRDSSLGSIISHAWRPRSAVPGGCGPSRTTSRVLPSSWNSTRRFDGQAPP
jgi:hypothetical protein